MAIGDGQFEDTAKQVDNSANKAGEALFADSHPTKAVDKVVNAPIPSDATPAPAEKLDNTANANDKAGDKSIELEKAITANLPESAAAKIASLNSTPEGQKLLTQEHKAGNVMAQFKAEYPFAFEQAKLS